jgi:cytidylate kinase
VERALLEHQLPGNLKRFMPEDVTPELQSSLEVLMGLHPSSWSLFQTVSETILRLAKEGNVVLVGRGANLVTAHLNDVLHVRLIAPLEKRIETVAELYQLNHSEAAAFLRKNDRARARYVERYFQKRIDDPKQYHLTINTGLIGYEAAARMIVDAVQASVPAAFAARSA